MATVFVVLQGVRKTIFLAPQLLPGVREKKVIQRSSPQHLPHKSGLLVDAQTSVKARQMVVGSGEVIGSTQKTDERVFRADVMLKPQYRVQGILVDDVSQPTLLLRLVINQE